MKVLLTQSVSTLGDTGDVKVVADGFARNYLIPRGYAVPATASVLKQAEVERKNEERREAKNAAENAALAKRIEATTVVLNAKVGQQQQRLYGAITATDIAVALAAQLGVEIDRRHVDLPNPIRHLGEHKVPIRIARSLVPLVTVSVQSAS